MKCPKCGWQMTGGAPHTGNAGEVQYECRPCNVFIVVRGNRVHSKQ
jgi:hypothetical protein